MKKRDPTHLLGGGKLKYITLNTQVNEGTQPYPSPWAFTYIVKDISMSLGRNKSPDFQDTQMHPHACMHTHTPHTHTIITYTPHTHIIITHTPKSHTHTHTHSYIKHTP